MQKTLSILLPTIEGQETKMAGIHYILAKQIKQYNLKDRVEILECKVRNNEHSRSWQANQLIQGCQGKYAMVIEPDGLVSADCIVTIINKIDVFMPDVVALTGTQTVNGLHPKKMHFSTKYKEWLEVEGVLQRPPMHLNPIKTSISKKIFFKEMDYQLATKEWSMELSQSGLLKTEADYDSEYYFQQQVILQQQ